jgi:hypothetical protein
MAHKIVSESQAPPVSLLDVPIRDLLHAPGDVQQFQELVVQMLALSKRLGESHVAFALAARSQMDRVPTGSPPPIALIQAGIEQSLAHIHQLLVFVNEPPDISETLFKLYDSLEKRTPRPELAEPGLHKLAELSVNALQLEIYSGYISGVMHTFQCLFDILHQFMDSATSETPPIRELGPLLRTTLEQLEPFAKRLVTFGVRLNHVLSVAPNSSVTFDRSLMDHFSVSFYNVSMSIFTRCHEFDRADRDFFRISSSRFFNNSLMFFLEISHAPISRMLLLIIFTYQICKMFLRLH